VDEFLSVHLFLEIMGQRPAFAADGGKVTEALERGFTRGLARKSLVLEAPDELFDVRGEFVIDFLIDGPPPEQARTGTEQLPHRLTPA